jgi:hypothetical protein
MVRDVLKTIILAKYCNKIGEESLLLQKRCASIRTGIVWYSLEKTDYVSNVSDATIQAIRSGLW